MATVSSKDGAILGYETKGRGPVLIFVHGAMQFRGSDPQTPALRDMLAEKFTTVLYDRRGRGQSTDILPYAVDREVEDIAAIIDASGAKASLFGMSSGAVLAIQAAAAGAAIEKLVLYEPPFIVDDSRPDYPSDYVETLDRHIAAGERSEAVAYFMTVAVGLPADQVEPMKRGGFWSVMEGVAHTIAYDARVMTEAYAGGRFPAAWKSLRTPILVIDGGASLPFLPAAADAVAAALPNGVRKTLGGEGHGADPTVLAPVIVEFAST